MKSTLVVIEMANNVTVARRILVMGMHARGISFHFHFHFHFHRPAVQDAEPAKCAIIILRVSDSWSNLFRGESQLTCTW